MSRTTKGRTVIATCSKRVAFVGEHRLTNGDEVDLEPTNDRRLVWVTVNGKSYAITYRQATDLFVWRRVPPPR